MTGQELKKIIKNGGWSVKEFAELVGFSEGSLRGVISTGKISTQLIAAVRLAQENAELKNRLKNTDSSEVMADYENLKKALKKAIL